jgi:hypothetical protein
MIHSGLVEAWRRHGVVVNTAVHDLGCCGI